MSYVTQDFAELAKINSIQWARQKAKHFLLYILYEYTLSNLEKDFSFIGHHQKDEDLHSIETSEYCLREKFWPVPQRCLLQNMDSPEGPIHLQEHCCSLTVGLV